VLEILYSGNVCILSCFSVQYKSLILFFLDFVAKPAKGNVFLRLLDSSHELVMTDHVSKVHVYFNLH